MESKVCCVELHDLYSDGLCEIISHIEELSRGDNRSRAKHVEAGIRNITHSFCNIEADWSDIKSLLLQKDVMGGKHAVIVTPDGFMLKNGEIKVDLLIISIEGRLLHMSGYNSTQPRLVWQTEPKDVESREIKALTSAYLLSFGLNDLSRLNISSDVMSWTEQTKFNWIVFHESSNTIFTSSGCFDRSAISDKHKYSEYEISENVENKPQTVKVGNKMASTKLATTATTVLAKNKTAAVQAAKVTTGKIAIKQVTKLISPKLPIIARGYVDTPLGRLAVANLFNFVVTQYLPNSQKASLVADAMLEGAMFDVASSLDIEGLVENVLDGIDTSKLQKAIEAKMKEEE